MSDIPTARPSRDAAEPAGSLRADAARNRQRIVDAACELFRQQGLDVALEEIAQRAGVGIATLYRRFPTRAELAAAAFAEMFTVYTRVIERAAAEADSWEGVRRLVYELCELQASDAALRDLVTMRFPESPEVERLTAVAQESLEGLLARARATGQLRADADVTDIALVLIGNNEIVKRTERDAPSAWRRYAALQIDALRARAEAEELPSPPTRDQVISSLMR
ncbi:MAG: TetR/AcrR family transcriptional regulator [Acidimicrobiaceae bacterium]|nr:TetR/AcrR family transcriptional regulator [Acidimicrobiaceae bacterium]